jgi:hypothetical protein
VPGSKRADLYYACLRAPDHITATLAVLQAHLRLPDVARTTLIGALRDLGATTRYPFMPDRLDRRHLTTPLIDLLEVAEFVGEE